MPPAPLLKRAVQWLVNGDPGAACEGLQGQRGRGGQDRRPQRPEERRPATGGRRLQRADRRQLRQHQQIAGTGQRRQHPSLSATVRARLQAGLPILFVHPMAGTRAAPASRSSPAWACRKAPTAVTTGTRTGCHPAAPGRVRSSWAAPMARDPALVQQIVDGSWRTDYDWSKCTSVRSHHLRRRAGTERLQQARRCIERRPDAYNQKAQNLFALPGTTSLRLWLLWADAVRQNIRYPMDKAADTALPGNLRRRRHRRLRARGRRGTEGTGQLRRPAPTVDAGIGLGGNPGLTLPSAQGFTAVGRMAAPGKRLSIRIEDAGQASLAVGLNTQRIGSTRLWNTRQYDRPRFLKTRTSSSRQTSRWRWYRPTAACCNWSTAAPRRDRR